MKKLTLVAATIALSLIGLSDASAQDTPGYECDNQFGSCGTPEQSGGGGGCGGGSILVNNTDLGDTYQFADDYDDDGVEDNFDNCAHVANLDQADSDGDGVGDGCDSCLAISNALQFDIDGDGLGDACDDDKDGDNILNTDDNCDAVPNPLINGLTVQPDTDGNGVGDACDDDIDGDSIPNLEDGCPMDASITSPDENQRAFCFPDADGDSIPDVNDNCQFQYNPQQENLNGNGLGDMCDPDVDGDGVHNPYDNCDTAANAKQIDLDRDGLGDACDSNFCYTVFGDQANCLDPKGSFQIYAPNLLGETGQPLLLRIFSNRENQAMRYTWRVLSQPEAADVALTNATGTVTISSPYEYRYLQNEAPLFYATHPGEYVIEVAVETVWEDRVSGVMNDVATFQAVVTMDGDEADLPASASSEGGCQVASTNATTSGAWLLLLGFVGLVFRRRKE